MTLTPLYATLLFAASIIALLFRLYMGEKEEVAALRKENTRLVEKLGYEYGVTTPRRPPTSSVDDDPYPDSRTPVGQYFRMKPPPPLTDAEKRLIAEQGHL